MLGFQASEEWTSLTCKKEILERRLRFIAF